MQRSQPQNTIIRAAYNVAVLRDNYRTIMQLSGMDEDAIEVLPHAAAYCRTL